MLLLQIAMSCADAITLIAKLCLFAVAHDSTPKVQVFASYSFVHAGSKPRVCVADFIGFPGGRTASNANRQRSSGCNTPAGSGTVRFQDRNRRLHCSSSAWKQ